jgi:glycerate 2-kinase
MAPRFDPAVLAPDPPKRRLMLDVLEAGLHAVEPAAAVNRHLGRDGNYLVVGDSVMALPGAGVTVLALGKAAAAMASAAVDRLAVPVRGIVVSPEPAHVPGLEPIQAAHPLPDTSSQRAGRRMLELASEAGSGDLVIVLLSGGGSALAELPAAGLDLADIVATNEVLLRSGAAIEEINVVRKHISALKGGRLAAAAAPARLITLAISDVAGGSPATIASGPTLPDPSTYSDALEIVERRHLDLPEAVVQHLDAGVSGRIADTPTAGRVFDEQAFVVVASGADAAAAARAAAASRNIDADVESNTMSGQAREMGVRIADRARRLNRRAILIYAGETTVTVTGSGLGGRNQELALAAAITLDGNAGTLVAALGTDGIDGPTDAAGAMVDGLTLVRGGSKGLDAAAALANNDSNSFLAASGDLLRCGPTGTNVGDLVLAFTDHATSSD